MGLVVLAQMLMYTYFGTMIISAHENLADIIMEVDWLSWSPKRRRILLMVLLRYHRDERISFLNWIHCSQQALRLLVANIFNMFALLQNIKRKSGRHNQISA